MQLRGAQERVSELTLAAVGETPPPRLAMPAVPPWHPTSLAPFRPPSPPLKVRFQGLSLSHPRRCTGR